MSTPRSGGSPAKCALNAAVLSAFAIAAGSVVADDHRGISQSGEQKNMELVGHVDLQGRGAYQPNFIKYPDGRIIAFAGLHPSPNFPAARAQVHFGAKASPWSSLIGAILLPPRFTSALTGCRVDNRVEPDLCPPRFTVRSPRMSIPMPPASS